MTAPRTTTLVRERLLREGRALPRVCVIAAPAGYGKSVLLAQLTSRLGTGGVAAAAREWARDDALLSAARSGTRRRYLAVDDFHELEGTPAEAAILELAEEGPPDLRVVLATRAAPAANLSRLRASGDLRDFTPDDLRFRSWEVDDLFRDVYREPLTREETTALARRTEGWAACLHLFHLATDGLGPQRRRAALAGMRGTSGLTASYLTQNVLDSLPRSVREFLVGVAPLSTLTAASCDALLGRGGSREMLDELTRRHLVEPSLDGRTWRWRQVLRTHLEAVLDETAGAAGRWAGAAELLERQGLVAEAVRAYGRAGERGAVARLLAGHGPLVAAKPALVTDDAGPVCDDDPWLLLAAARWERAQGLVTHALASYRRAEEAFEGGPGAGLCTRERRALGCWVEPLERPSDDWSGSVRAALSQRPVGIPEGAPELARGLVELVAGEVERAAVTLEAVSEDARSTAAAGVAARIGLAVALLLRHDDRGRELAEQAAEEAEMLDLPWVVRLAQAVRALAAEVRGPRPRFDDPAGELASALLSGLGSLRRAENALPAFDDALELARRLGLVALEAWARSGRALALARSGDGDARDHASSAEAFARAAGTCGPRALGLLALAESSANPSLAGTAAALARESGIALPGHTAPAVRVRCLGGLAIESGGEPVSLDELRPRARQVLRFLLLSAPQPAHREVLVEALWPHLPPERAASSLHVAVSSLRHVFGESGGIDVARDGDAYVLHLEPGAEVDLLRFRAATGGAAGPGAAREALDLYRGDVFPEEGPAEWVVEAREQLRDRAVRAATSLAKSLLDGDPRAAAAACERGLEIDRRVDDLWRLLIDACERAGNHAEASRAAVRYERVLDELGVAFSSR